MFFVLRSAVCIGLVVSALPGRPGAEPASLTDLRRDVGLAATAAIDSYCRDNPARCLRSLALSAEAARLPDTATGRKLRSSSPVSAVRADDRSPLGT